MSTPFFSIIIPVFNREKLIAETINSVLNQTNSDFEVIAVDDCSSDESINSIESVMINDDRIKLIKHTKNKGRSAARNTGLMHAKGKWICYLDSDDIYEKNHLEFFHQLIIENPSYLCFAQKSGILGLVTNNSHSIELKDITFSDVLKKNLFVPNQICHIKEIGVQWFEEVAFSEDLLFVREILVNHSILYSQNITSYLRIHEDRSMNRVSNEKFINDNIHAINHLFMNYPKIEPGFKKIIESRTHLICLNLNYYEGYLNNKHLLKNIFSNIYTYFDYLFYLFIFKLSIVRPFKQLSAVVRRLLNKKLD